MLRTCALQNGIDLILWLPILNSPLPLPLTFYSGQAEVEEEEDTSQEELSALLEEAHMPLHSLLAKYGASNPSTDAEGTYT